MNIASIVEGQSEVESVPILLRRLLSQIPDTNVDVARPFRVRRSQVVKPGQIERAIKLVMADRENLCAILVLLDADGDRPCVLGPRLLARCQRSTNLPVTVVLATRETEAWFLGAGSSLRGVRGVNNTMIDHTDAEEITNPKASLNRQMNGRYLVVDDQPALMARMDLDAAHTNCSSFRKLKRDLTALISP